MYVLFLSVNIAADVYCEMYSMHIQTYINRQTLDWIHLVILSSWVVMLLLMSCRKAWWWDVENGFLYTQIKQESSVIDLMIALLHFSSYFMIELLYFICFIWLCLSVHCATSVRIFLFPQFHFGINFFFFDLINFSM